MSENWMWFYEFFIWIKTFSHLKYEDKMEKYFVQNHFWANILS